MHAAAFSPRGGVSPRGTLLQGQSIIEYVLIAAVIGLVVVFAGPQVSGAIRNQFNLVGNTVNGGASGGTEGGGASGGGDTGTASATVQAAVAKDAKDWILDEQKAVAEDIAAKGEASPAYAKAKAAMDAGTKWSIKLTNGETLEYRIIGINHDDLADGSGKAGLTFLATSTGIKFRVNATNTNVAAGTVPDDHAPGFGLPVPAERPRAGAVGLDAVERVDGTVVPFDSPWGVLAVGAALNEGCD